MQQLTRKQKEAKARFWARIKKNPALDAGSMSMAEIARVAGDAELVLLLANDQFKSWFLDEDTNRNSLEAGVSCAVSKLIDIVSIDLDEIRLGESKAIKLGDVVRACEVMLKYAGYEPIRNKVIEVADRDIGKMNEAELDNFLNARLKAVKKTAK